MTKYDSHCEQPGCICDHNKCYKGWIDNTVGTWPCIYCREGLVTRLTRVEGAREKGYPPTALYRLSTTMSP